MTTESLITPEARAMIGKTTPSMSEEVSAGAIRRWCKAVFDTNPLHTDPEYAKRGPHRGLVAPPSFYMTLARPFAGEDHGPRPSIEAKRGVAGSSEVQFFAPICPGDVITRQGKLADIYEKPGRTGPMVFIVTESTCTNQRGEVVAKTRSASIRY